MAERFVISKMAAKNQRRKHAPHARLKAGGMGTQSGMKGTPESTEISGSKMSSNFQTENTYKLPPGRQEKFQTETVQKVMSSTLESKLHNLSYDASICGGLAKMLTNEITARVKEYQWHRYKLVVQVFVGQNGNQGVQVASRCVWDPEMDTYATVNYENVSLFAVASCYAVYYE